MKGEDRHAQGAVAQGEVAQGAGAQKHFFHSLGWMGGGGHDLRDYIPYRYCP
jgi:hypothetical protein